MSQDRVKQLLYEMLDTMYQCSMPSISWWEVEDRYSMSGYDFYRDFYLCYGDCNCILDMYLKDIPRAYRNGFSLDFMSYAPSGRPRTFKDRGCLDWGVWLAQWLAYLGDCMDELVGDESMREEYLLLAGKRAGLCEVFGIE